MLPMILGLMIASIGSGQIIARTGRYRIFPILGTALMSVGFFWLTFLRTTARSGSSPARCWCIGLGLGQLMQTLTIASQNSVGLRDMGVATSSSTFFRQIGGTLGTAVLLSLLFTVLPANVQTSFADAETLTDALDAALDPAVADRRLENADDHGPDLRSDRHAAHDCDDHPDRRRPDSGGGCRHPGGRRQGGRRRDPGRRHRRRPRPPRSPRRRQAAATQIEQEIPVAQIADDGTVTLDFSDDAARAAYVETVVPTIEDQFASGGGTSSMDSSALDDTSFLTGADPRLTKPILVAFNASAVLVYQVAMWVVIIAFVLSLFFRTPPLRAKSALQEAADNAADDELIRATKAADTAGVLVQP